MNIFDPEAKETIIKEVVRKVSQAFPSFGGGNMKSSNSPIALALKDEPPMFSAGVPIEEVVRFIFELEALYTEDMLHVQGDTK